MKSQNKIVVVAILTIAFFALINVNHTTHAAPRTPTCVAPANEAVYAAGTPIPLNSNDFYDSDGGTHEWTNWRVIRYDDETEWIYNTTYSTELTEVVLDPVQEPDDYLPEGFKYVWQVQHVAYMNNPSEWSNECTFKVGSTIPESLPAIAAGTSMSDFGMKSIVHWPDNPDPLAVFGITYDPNEYRIGTWDPEQGKYIEFGKGLTIEPGRSYWVLARNDLDVTINGIPVNESYPVEVCLHTHPSTKMGWNMIAPPNKANYYWNQVKVASLEYPEEVAIGDASRLADRVINHRIYEWKDGEYIAHKLDENFVLEHYKGYWVKAIVEEAYLVFDYDAQVPVHGQFSPRNTMLAWKGRAVQWMKRLLPAPREAIADNDLPPMPMESIDSNTNPLFEGCFFQTLK